MERYNGFESFLTKVSNEYEQISFLPNLLTILGEMPSLSMGSFLFLLLGLLSGVLLAVCFQRLRPQGITLPKQGNKSYETYATNPSFDEHLAYCCLNTEGLITHWSVGIERLMGHPPHAFVGKHFTCLFQRQVEDATALLKTAVRVGKVTFQASCFGPNDLLLATDVVILHEKGRTFTGFTMVLWDISKQKSIEQGLQESLELFSSTFYQAATGIVHVRMSDGRFLRANNKACEMLGYTEEEYCQKTIPEITHPEDIQSDLENTIKMIHGEIDFFSMEKRLLRKDGSIVWTKLTATSVSRDALGHALYGMAVVEDISKLKEAEQAVQESEERFRLMADVAPVMIFVTDDFPKNIYVNKNYTDYTGLDYGEALGINWQQLIHPEDRADYLKQIAESFEQQKPFSTEVRIRKKDKSYGWILTTAVPRYTGSGKFLGYIGTGVDITERKKVEVTLEKAKHHAEELNLRKSEFLALMSHELRTPLNSIIGYSMMITRGMGGPLTDRQSKYIQNITSSGKHLLTLINDILDISKIEAGKMEVSISQFEIGPILDEIKELMRNHLEKKQVTLQIEIDETPLFIDADIDRFKQILINLTNNAIKFNHTGGNVWIRIFKSSDEKWIVSQIIDTGIGIPSDKISNLFSKFYQVDSSTSRVTEGTGLGLALTKELVQLHGGKITVESQEGLGSTFTFKLPFSANKLPQSGGRDGSHQEVEFLGF